MWRILLSIGMMFGGMAFSAFAVIIIFLIVPTMWEALFGPTGAVFAALAALGLAIWAASKMMGLGDRLSGMRESRRTSEAEVAAALPDVPADWHEYTAEIVRNKRWAFYRRTRQFDRLAELEAESRKR
ncbi:MAG TPA: hypothetical protein VGW38_28105 [Chloroflexota bacterium]|nr:hypothetical protein [Chloroflexota bacterium]